MKTILILTLCSVCCDSIAAPKSYSLEQLLDSARHNNITLRNAQRTIDAAHQQRREAFTKYFPNISATGIWFNANKGMAQTTINPAELIPAELGSTLAQTIPAEMLSVLGSPVSLSMMKNGTIAAVTAVQPVFAGGQIVNGNRLAKVGEEAAHLQRRLSENDIEKTTEQYYWQMVTLQEKLRTIEAVSALLNGLHHDVDVAVRAGLALRNDMLQVQLRQNDTESQRLKLQNALSMVRLTLAQYCGLRDTSFTISVPASLPLVCCDSIAPASLPLVCCDSIAALSAAPGTPSVSPSSSIPLPAYQSPSEALPATAEYQLLAKQVEAAKLQKRLTVGENLPSIAVGAGYNYHNLLDNNHTFAMVFATVSVPISNWWGGSHAIKRKKIEYQKAIDEQRDKSELLQIRMQNAWNSVTEARQQLAIAERSIEQATENLRLNRNFYRAGTIKMSDLLDAQLLYQQALDRRTDAYASYQNKLLEYRQATGQ